MATKMLRLLFISSMVLLMFACEDENLDDFTDPRSQFLGTWDVSESCFKDAYSVEIVKDPSNSAQVLVNNFWNMGYTGSPPSGLVVGNKIYFTNAAFFDDVSEVNGEGFLDKNKINWQYTVFDGADMSTCNAIYTLQ